jgi:hypothetical protein
VTGGRVLALASIDKTTIKTRIGKNGSGWKTKEEMLNDGM